jgi:hypothetical protein
VVRGISASRSGHRCIQFIQQMLRFFRQ